MNKKTLIFLFCLILFTQPIKPQGELMGLNMEQKLRYVEDSEPLTIDPITVSHKVSQRITEMLFAALYKADQFAVLQPELAEDFPQMDVSKQIATIKLKSGLKWSDGKPLTAKDIIFTIEAAKNNNSDTFNREIYNYIKNVSMINNQTLSVEFTKKIPERPERYLPFFIIPKHAFFKPEIKKDNSYCLEPRISNGGFKYKNKSATGLQFFLEKNENYYKPDVPIISNVNLQVFSDRTAHKEMLVSDATDLLTYIRPEDIPDVINDPQFDMMEYQATEYEFFAINCRHEILNIREVRQAINLGFNRKDVLKSYFQNSGDLMAGPLPPTHFGYNPDVDPWPYDQVKAAELLESIGMVDTDEDGIREWKGKPVYLEFLVYARENNLTNTQIWKSFTQQMQQIGLKIEMVEFTPELYSDKLMRHDFDIAVAGWHVKSQSDIFPFFIGEQAKPGGKNLGNYVNVKVDSLLIISRYTNDFALKVELLKLLQSNLHDDAPYVFLWHLRHRAAFTRKLKNVSIDPNNFFTTIEDWYFE